MTGSKRLENPVLEKDAAPINPTTKPIRVVDYLMIGAVVLIWGVAFVGMKAMVKDAPPLKSAGLRFFIGALPLMVIALQPKRLKKFRAIDFGKFALLGFLQTSLMFGINFTALQFVPAGITSVVLNTNPFFVVLLAHLLIAGDRLNKQKLAGLALGFGGVLVLVLGGKGFGEVAFYWPLLLLLSAAIWGFSTVLVKLYGYKDMLSLTAWQSFIGSLPLLALGFGLEQEPVHLTWSFGFWTLYVALLGSSFAWWAWYKVLQRYSASRVSVFLFMIPVCGVASGVILLGESLNAGMLIGGALVVAGIVVVNRRIGGGQLTQRYLQPLSRIFKPAPAIVPCPASIEENSRSS
jgi:drug/metabolite transporter (DMT)-like permease